MKPATALHIILWTATLCSAQSITVRVYDYAGLPAAQWSEAAGNAGRVLAKTGHPVTWLACRGAEAPPESASTCQTDLGANDYVLRILPGERNPAPGVRRTLAQALVEHGAGRYATLYLDAIQAHAGEMAVPQNILLAYATAHEIIHLVRGPAHSSAGVMKEKWTRRDSTAISQLSLPVK